MKKKFFILTVVMSFMLIALSSQTVLAIDFNFLGINWSDGPKDVVEKINQSGYARSIINYMDDPKDTGVPLQNIFHQMVDKERYDSLFHLKAEATPSVRKNIIIKKISFEGKKESPVNIAQFLFTADGTLLTYYIDLNRSFATADEDTGDSEFYNNLVKKYGKPNKKVGTRSRVWSTKDQSLYYTNFDELIRLTYISEKNLATYIKYIEGLNMSAKMENKNKQSEAAKDF